MRIESWAKRKVCSFCDVYINARYDELSDKGWFGYAPIEHGVRIISIIGCPVHKEDARQVAGLWLDTKARWEFPTLHTYLLRHGWEMEERRDIQIFLKRREIMPEEATALDLLSANFMSDKKRWGEHKEI